MTRFLLCLDMRREHFPGACRAAHFDRVRDALERARGEGWRVLHAHSPRRGRNSHGALAGFEPRAEEAVFALSGLSVFDEPQLALAARRPQRLHVAGAVYSRAGLASLLAAQEAGLAIDVLADACIAPQLDSVRAEHVLGLAGASSSVRVVRQSPRFNVEGENVICLETWRT